MTRGIIFISLMLFLSAETYSQESFKKSLETISTDLCTKMAVKGKKKIVVLFITDINKAQTTIGKYMADIVSFYVVNDQNGFSVFDRENLHGIAEAKKLITEGYIDANNAKQLGKILSVEAIIVGNYTVLSESLSLTLKALDVNDGFVIAQSLKDLLIDKDAGALLGITVGTHDNNINKGFNNRPLNSNESYNNPETVNKDCEAQNTGDYCFLNNSKSSKVFRFFFDQKPYMNMGPLSGQYYEDIGLLSGETKCIYNKKARSYLYEIWGKNPENETVVLNSGNILIEKCKSKTFIIK